MTKDEALKLALEALEYFSDTATLNMDKAFSEDAITAIKEALAQPEQEPVGDFYITKDMAEHIKKLEVDWTICASGSKRPTEKKVVPVFVGNTTPPQRKPLTDEEIAEEFYKFEAAGAWYQFARAIEAAHGIKGEA